MYQLMLEDGVLFFQAATAMGVEGLTQLAFEYTSKERWFRAAKAKLGIANLGGSGDYVAVSASVYPHQLGVDNVSVI